MISPENFKGKPSSIVYPARSPSTPPWSPCRNWMPRSRMEGEAHIGCSWGHGVMELDICIGYETPHKKKEETWRNHLLPWTDSLWFVLSTGIRRRIYYRSNVRILQSNAINMHSMCLFFSRLKGRTRVVCVCQIQALWRGWGISSVVLPHHLSLRSPTKSPRKLVAAAATAEEAVLVHQSTIFGRKIPHVVPKNPPHGVSGFPGSMSLTASITLGGSKKANPNMPLTRTG